MTPLVSWTYLSIVAIAVVTYARRADHKFLMVLILSWLLGYPVLVQQEIMPHFASMGFDLQPSRILLLMLIPLLLIYRLNSYRKGERAYRAITLVDIFVIGYVLFSIFSMVWNYDNLGPRLGAVGIQLPLTFGAMYLTARDHMSSRDYSILGDAIVVFAVFSAVVGLLQFGFSQDFFRVGVYRNAFGDVSRSTGAFSQEYEQGMFLTFAMVIFILRSGRLGLSQFIVTAVFALAIIVTFQRMPWIVFFLTAAVIFYMRAISHQTVRVIGPLVIGLLAVFLLWIPWQSLIFSKLPSDFIYGRLLVDTLTLRLQFNIFAFSLLPKYPFGLGYTVLSPIYTSEYFLAGLPRAAGGIPYTIHNGFLSAAVRFGIGGGLAFGGMLVGFLFAFGRHISSSRSTELMPFLFCMIFVLYNVTQDFAFPESQVALIFALLMGYFTFAYQKRRSTIHQISLPGPTNPMNQLGYGRRVEA